MNECPHDVAPIRRQRTLQPKRIVFAITSIKAFETNNISTTKNFLMRLPTDTQRVTIDTPASLQGSILMDTLMKADLIIVTVLPSPIDIHSATRFIGSLLLSGAFHNEDKKLLMLANRVKTHTFFR